MPQIKKRLRNTELERFKASEDVILFLVFYLSGSFHPNCLQKEKIGEPIYAKNEYLDSGDNQFLAQIHFSGPKLVLSNF